MPEQNSFDIVSKVDMQELKNAMDQATKEIKQRFDFKDSISSIVLEKDEVILTSDDSYRLKSVIDILQSKLIKRNISLKSLEYEKIEEALGKTVRQKIKIKQGIASETAKEITKEIKNAKLKVQAQIQGDQVRVVGKSRDELQSAIALLKKKDFGADLQFTNFR
ncbi:MAG: YajQ family cyclic di-GMP-binding protein [Nitrospirae bacterium]|nr:YajQ family cyclic di-GMP-binding protein [Nitrospirota bacterium]MBI3593869.1 YajQ family cyclic di-GMP-binding protein [Nitrospirota bacterium]